MLRKFKIHDYAPNAPKKPTKARARLWEVKAFPRSAPTNGSTSFNPPASKFPDFTKNPRPDLGGSADFKPWVDHYVRVVGHYVSMLNGLQFDLEIHQPGGGPGKKDILQAFATKIDEFATALHILKDGDYVKDPNNPANIHPINPNGPGNPNKPRDPLEEYPLNPRELIWPLIGQYYFRYHFRRLTDPTQNVPVEEYNYHVDLSLLFENDPVTNLCTNCQLKLRISDKENMLDEQVLSAGDTATEDQDPDYISSSSSYTATSSSG